MKTLRLLATAAALMFLITTAPAAAEPGDCPPCANCHSSCSGCSSYVMHAIGNCCGAIGGWASCVNSSWGFYVDCEHARECQCNSFGENCDSEFRMLE